MNETAERVEKAGDINEAYRLVYIYGKENPKDIDGLIALNKLLIMPKTMKWRQIII